MIKVSDPALTPVSDTESRCFMTTACVRERGMADDCEILTLLRGFRDGYMMTVPAGVDMVEHYYAIARSIGAAIDKDDESERIYDDIYAVLVDCVDGIKEQEFEKVLNMYRTLVFDLESRYLPGTSRVVVTGARTR